MVIITARILLCRKWHKLEAIGTAVVVAGALALMSDDHSSKKEGETNIVLGDLWAASACIFFAIFLLFND